MVAYNKYQNFVEDLIEGVHDFDAHTFKIMLSNTAPNASTHTVRADSSELGAGSGYTSGGNTTTITTSEASGTGKVVGADPATWTAASGTIGPFRYAILYNDTPTSPADPLIGWWDYGSSITLADTETFTVDFDPTNGIFTIA
jgi:hypothetical protein